MERRRRIAALTLAGLVSLALAFPSAVLAVSSGYSIRGVEVYATPTRGDFVGTATGWSGDYATWKATVYHTEVGTTATITGGSARLVTSDLVTITGSFSGGGLSLVDEASGCGTQTYYVWGWLNDVRRSDSSAVGTGTFNALLTHYRASVWGRCLTYSASVKGTIALAF